MTRNRKLTKVLIAMLLFCGTAMTSQAADTEVEKLGAWVGKWNSTGKLYATPFSKAMDVTSETTCNWAVNHGFVVCDQLVNLPDGKRNSLSVYTYDTAAKAYKLYAVERDSPTRTVPLSIDGQVWTMGGSFQHEGKTVKVRTTNEFVGTSLVKFKTEFTFDDGATWTVMNEGTETRVNQARPVAF